MFLTSVEGTVLAPAHTGLLNRSLATSQWRNERRVVAQ